jgi:hypothetical protein
MVSLILARLARETALFDKYNARSVLNVGGESWHSEPK